MEAAPATEKKGKVRIVAPEAINTRLPIVSQEILPADEQQVIDRHRTSLTVGQILLIEDRDAENGVRKRRYAIVKDFIESRGELHCWYTKDGHLEDLEYPRDDDVTFDVQTDQGNPWSLKDSLAFLKKQKWEKQQKKKAKDSAKSKESSVDVDGLSELSLKSSENSSENPLQVTTEELLQWKPPTWATKVGTRVHAKCKIDGNAWKAVVTGYDEVSRRTHVSYPNTAGDGFDGSEWCWATKDKLTLTRGSGPAPLPSIPDTSFSKIAPKFDPLVYRLPTEFIPQNLKYDKKKDKKTKSKAKQKLDEDSSDEEDDTEAKESGNDEQVAVIEVNKSKPRKRRRRISVSPQTSSPRRKKRRLQDSRADDQMEFGFGHESTGDPPAKKFRANPSVAAVDSNTTAVPGDNERKAQSDLLREEEDGARKYYPTSVTIANMKWTRKPSQQHRRYFYLNETQEVSWNPWHEAGETAPFEELNGGWTKFYKNSIEPYYYHFKTRKTQSIEPSEYHREFFIANTNHRNGRHT